MSRRRGPRGFVLAGILFTLTAVLALAGAWAFLALQESRLGRNRVGTVRAAEAARAANSSVLATWTPARYNTLAIGATVQDARALVRRLSERVFLIEGTGLDPVDSVEQRAGLLVHLDPPPLDRAALRVRQAPSAGVAAGVAGTDSSPPGWRCSSRDSITTSTMHLPLSDSAFWALGVWNWARLATWAARGWSADSFELRYAPGDLTLTAGRFLGVLVVEGDLSLRGSAEVWGVVFVRGQVVAIGTGGRIVGAAVASEALLGAGASAGALQLEFSSCVAQGVLLRLSPALR
jgi:hypothetical protein